MCRLLIVRWGAFQIVQAALELEIPITLFEKCSCSGWIKWYAGKAIIEDFSMKDGICEVINGRLNS